MVKWWRRLVQWLTVDLWLENLRLMSLPRALCIGVFRVTWYAARNFDRNHGSIRAAGLSLTTMLALVPLLAIAMGLGELLGYRQELEDVINRQTEILPPELQEVVDQIQRLVAATSFTGLGTIGSGVVLYTVLRLYQATEEALNAIHGVPERPLWRRLTNFVAVIFMLPPLAVAALLLKAGLQDPWFLEWAWGWVRTAYMTSFEIVSHVLTWIAFTLLYRWMPNAKINLTSAMIGGVVAGSSWVFLFGIYLQFQVGVALNNAIYGTLAALPLLVIYLQLSWTVLLFGAELSFGVQNLHRLRPSGIAAGQTKPDVDPKGD